MWFDLNRTIYFNYASHPLHIISFTFDKIMYSVIFSVPTIMLVEFGKGSIVESWRKTNPKRELYSWTGVFCPPLAFFLSTDQSCWWNNGSSKDAATLVSFDCRIVAWSRLCSLRPIKGWRKNMGTQQRRWKTLYLKLKKTWKIDSKLNLATSESIRVKKSKYLQSFVCRPLHWSPR